MKRTKKLMCVVMAAVMIALSLGITVQVVASPDIGQRISYIDFDHAIVSFYPAGTVVEMTSEMHSWAAFALEVPVGTTLTIESVTALGEGDFFTEFVGISSTVEGSTPMFFTGDAWDEPVDIRTFEFTSPGLFSLGVVWGHYNGFGDERVYFVVTDAETPLPTPTPAPTPTPQPTPQPTPAPTTNDVTVTIDGAVQSFEVAPRLVSGRTMLPLRAIAEALGMEVEHERATNTAILTIDDIIVTHVIGTNEITVNGETTTFDVASMVVESRTLVPVRMLAEAIGADVEWEPSTRTAIIITN